MSEVGQEGSMRLARYSFLLMKFPGQPGTQRLGWWVSSWWFWQRCCTPTLLDVQSLYDVAFGHMSCFWETSQYCPPIWEKWSIVVIQITENKAIPGQGDTSRKVVGSNLGALAVFFVKYLSKCTWSWKVKTGQFIVFTRRIILSYN